MTTTTLVSTDSPSFDIDRIRELETENALLRARVRDLNRRLADTEPTELRPSELEGDDGSNEAFEHFLAVSDPNLDRVRRFLMG